MLSRAAAGRIPDFLSPPPGLRSSVMLSGRWWSAAPSPVRVPGEHLLGRQRERAALDRLLDAARASHGGVLVVHGEPGVVQDRAARVCGRGRAGVSRRPDQWGRGGNGAPVRGGAAAVFPVHRADGATPTAPTRRAWRRIRACRRAATESVSRRTGGPGAAFRGRGGGAAPRSRRRRAMARSRVCARACVRRPPPVGGEGCAGVRDASAGRCARAPA